jgi:hypothetical protein
LFDSYQAERLPIAASVLELSHAMVTTLNVASARRRRLRDRLLPAAVAVPALRHRFTGRMAELSVNYRGGSLTVPATRMRRGSLVPGDRLPDVPCLTPEGHPVGTLDLLATRHTLIILAGETADPSTVEALTARFERSKELLRVVLLSAQGLGYHPDHFTDPGLRAHDRYRARAGRLLLVRPDGYLVAAARLQRPERIEQYLLSLTRRADRVTTNAWSWAKARTCAPSAGGAPRDALPSGNARAHQRFERPR